MKKVFFPLLLLSLVLFSPLALAKWWDNDYNASKQITIIAGTTIDTNMTVDLNNLNTTSTASYLATCNDLRIVFQDTNEVQRAVTGCRSTNTKVYFKPLAAINSGSSNTDYKIYFDNPSATAPTIDMNTVALWGDRFEGASESGSWITGGTDHHSDINSQEHIEGTSSLTMRTTGTSTLRYNFGAINQGNVDLITHYLDQPSDVEGITFFPQIASTTGVMQDFRLGVQTDINTIGYVVFDGTGWRQISKPRTLAWHTVRIEYFDTNSHCAAYFDDTNVMGCGESNPTTRVLFDAEKTGTSDLNGYFDLFMVRKHVDNKPNLSMGADLNFGVDANISRTPGSPYYLDTENGITSVTIDFNDTSTYHNTKRYLTAWLVNDVNVSADQNLHYSFTTAGDYNISLIVDANAGANRYRDQQDYNLSIFNSPQGLDISFVNNDFNNNVDVNFTLTGTGTINYIVWGGTDFDFNRVGTTIRFDYNVSGVKQVCAIANGVGDINKLRCENFINSRVLVKSPMDEGTSAVLTPFDVSTNDSAQQTYTGQTLDLNVFIFNAQGNDQNVLFTIDYNASYYSGVYLIQTNATTTFHTLQPLLARIAISVNAVFHVIDVITQQTVPNIIITAKKGGILIGSTITDSTGTGTITLVVGDTYDLNITTLDGTILLTSTLRPIDLEYFIYVFLEEITTSPTTPQSIEVVFEPSTGQVFQQADGTIDLNQTISATNTTITSIRILIDQNGTTRYDQNFSSAGLRSQDLNAATWDLNYQVNVTVTIISGMGTTVKTQSYLINPFSSVPDFLTIINNFGVLLGAIGRLIFVVLSALVVTGGFVGLSKNKHVLVAIVLIWIGMFTAIGLNPNYVTWVPLPVFFFALLGGVAFYLNK